MAIVKIMTEGNDYRLTEDSSYRIAEKEILLKTDPAASRIQKVTTTYSVSKTHESDSVEVTTSTTQA